MNTNQKIETDYDRFADIETLRKLEPRELLRRLAQYTSVQEMMNIVRTVVREPDKIEKLDRKGPE